ncbi:MAG: DUF6265 family protein [Phenylobacterium sp.]|nr:DUF6265 family protein [Phenylobacterium sp.]
MRAHLALLAASILGLASAQAAPVDDVAGLAWLAGEWIEEKDGAVTREVWMAPLGGTMAGANQANRPGRSPFVEHMIISARPEGATFTALIPGQPPTSFVLRPGGPEGEAVFENLAHDFPQRVIYRRCGLDLCARIEGTVGDRPRAQDWRFRRAR